MSKTPVFIINYNRLNLPKNMADYLADADGVEPIIVDMNSTYPPLLEYYESCPHKVERLDANYGCCGVWTSGLLDKYEIYERYIITDPDLDLSGIPKDFLHILHLGLDRHSFAAKAGFSLEIKDVPESTIKPHVMQWERGYWSNKLDDMFYSAYIDTTFALYRSRIHDFPAVRTERPYTAKHMPWYYNKENIPEDELYYLRSVMEKQSFYSSLLLKSIEE